MIFTIKSNYIKITQSKNTCVNNYMFQSINNDFLKKKSYKDIVMGNRNITFSIL